MPTAHLGTLIPQYQHLADQIALLFEKLLAAARLNTKNSTASMASRESLATATGWFHDLDETLDMAVWLRQETGDWNISRR